MDSSHLKNCRLDLLYADKSNGNTGNLNLEKMTGFISLTRIFVLQNLKQNLICLVYKYVC